MHHSEEHAVDVECSDRAVVGTPDVVRSQINLKRRSPILKGKLAVLSPEISSPIISVDRFEIGTIDIFDLDR